MRAASALIIPVLLLASHAHVAAADQCVFTNTECTCIKRPPGDTCLRYISGSPGNEMCEAYACGEGHQCDCSGTELCDLKPSGAGSGAGTGSGVGSGSAPSATVTKYLPRSGTVPTIGATVACIPQTNNQQAVPQSPSPTATPSTTPPPSPSASPSTGVNPLAVLAPGAACDPPVVAGQVCKEPYVCDCAGVCNDHTVLTIDAMGDDNVVPLVCGKALGTPTSGSLVSGRWTYSGPCTTRIVFETTNAAVGENGVVAGITPRLSGWSTVWYPTQEWDIGRVAVNPTDLSFMTNGRFDYYASPEWKPFVIQSSLRRFIEYNNFALDHGRGDVWSASTGADVPAGKIYYMMGNPHCRRRW